MLKQFSVVLGAALLFGFAGACPVAKDRMLNGTAPTIKGFVPYCSAAGVYEQQAMRRVHEESGAEVHWVEGFKLYPRDREHFGELMAALYDVLAKRGFKIDEDGPVGSSDGPMAILFQATPPKNIFVMVAKRPDHVAVLLTRMDMHFSD